MFQDGQNKLEYENSLRRRDQRIKKEFLKYIKNDQTFLERKPLEIIAKLNQLKAFKSSYEELEHLFNDRSFEDVQKDTIIIPSVTNINFRYKNLIIRHPRKNLNIFL